MDGCPQRSSLLRLRHQLSNRHRSWGILDVEATRAIRQAEVGASRTMIERTENRFGLRPDYLAADSAYGSADNLAWLVQEKKIAPHIPVLDKSNRTDGTFSRSDFTWEAENDRYVCPAGKELSSSIEPMQRPDQ
jgi:hypothetical protein